MITADREADLKLRIRLAGMDPDEEPVDRPNNGELHYAPDPLVQSPLWQAHSRVMQRDAQQRRN